MSIVVPPPPGSGNYGSSRELAAQRRMTAAFIRRRPETIVFTPNAKTRRPDGGYGVTKGAPREPITVTFIEMSDQSGSPRPLVTLDGIERRVEMEIVAEYGAPIQVRDTFTHQGKEWEVVGIFYDNGYELRAWVTGRG